MRSAVAHEYLGRAKDAAIIACLVVVFALGAWPGQLRAAGVTQQFDGINLHVSGEYINAVLVPAGDQEFAPLFAGAATVTVTYIYDTNQPDTDPDPDTGTYLVATLTVSIPEIGLAASKASSSMQLSVFNDTSNPDDQFFAYVDGVDTFSSGVGLPDPVSFSASVRGDTSMVPDDSLPTGPLNWYLGGVSFDFIASDSSKRQVAMTFAPLPEPTTLSLLAFGVVGLAGRRKRK